MVTTPRFDATTPRRLFAVLVAAVLAIALLPAAALAGHNPNNEDPCADVPVANEFVDRDEALEAHRGSIDCMFYWSITTGSQDENGDLHYNPDQQVRRDQMAAFIFNTLQNAGYDLPDNPPDAFTDDDGSPFEGAINALADADIVRGTSATTYSPAKNIRRDQMASFIVQAANWAVGDEHPVESDGDDRFDDVSDRNFHKGNIEAGADAEPPLFRGVSEDEFNPSKNVRRDQMATFLANLFTYIFDPDQAVTPTVVELDENTVPQGGEVSGTIQGADSATVSGCGLDNENVEDQTNNNDETITFTLEIPQDQAPGECTLRFTVTRPNGQTAIRDATITVQEQATAVTDAPELIEAEFVRHTENPGGGFGAFQQTTVRYTFDEDVVAEPDAGLFYLVTFDGTRFIGQEATREEGDNASVLVVFGENPNRPIGGGDEVGQEEFADVTLATVDLNAVEDSDGNPNPEGDAPLNSITFQPGVTEAPDLVSIGNFREGPAEGQNAPTTTLVDFTFDENAFVAGDEFELILVDNTLIECTAARDANDAAVGNGTQTITVACPLEDNANEQITAADVARGVAVDGAVTDEDGGGNANPLQASDDPDGATTAPDLVSVTRNDDNTATFTFDQNVSLVLFRNPITGATAPNPGLFCLYDAEAAEECGTDVEQEDTPDNTVVVTFEGNVVNFAVGGNVRAGAVQGTNRAAQRNSNDEEPVDEANAFAGGQTVGPDLVSVERAVTKRTTNPTTGVTTDTEITFTFTFDEPVATAVPEGAFFIYDPEANRTVLTDCTTSGEATEDDFTDDTPTVECVVTASSGTQTGEEGDPPNAASGFEEAKEAVLGTVDDAAVTDRNGDINHEAASPIRDEAETA